MCPTPSYDTSVEAPRQQFPKLRKLIPKALHPTVRALRKRLTRPRGLEEPFYSVYPFTQVHPVRQENLFRLARSVEQRNVPGAIVECGVLDGGTAALMACATAASARPVHLFDSWSGLPKASTEDGAAATAWVGDAIGSPRRVRAVMRRLGIAPERLTFHQGWFNDTFPRANIEQIALMHLDADFYDSVKLALETWAPRVAHHGYIQIDDYSVFLGCRRAVDEYLARHPEWVLSSTGDSVEAFFMERMS